MELQRTAQQATDLLLQKGMTVSLAESCTGGMIAAALVGCPGVSEALLEGCVCYSNEAKQRTLGVLTETLRDHGAVSAECALEMVHGICDYTGSDTAIAVTGIAGPGGGTAEHPVGTVYMAIATEHGAQASRLELNDIGREAVRMEATASVFRALLTTLS